MAVEGYIFQQYAESLKKPLQAVVGEVLPMARAAGFRNIELSPAFFPPEGRDRTVSILRSQGLLTPSLYVGGSVHERDEADRTIAAALEFGNLCAPFGCKAIVTNPDPKRGDASKTDAELGVQADSLNRMGRALAQNGFELRVHHHTPQLAENAREWRHIVHHTNPEYVHICVDVDWVYEGGFEPIPFLRDVWVIEKASLVGEPVVALINDGTQWGPIDGTSALSQKIDEDFGSTQPGRVYVSASGDEGTLPNHAGADFNESNATIVNFLKANTNAADMQIWYTGSQPANVTITFADDGVVVGPVGPGTPPATLDGITIYQYKPGGQFYPWTSSGPDRAVLIQIVGHSGAGTVQIQGVQPGSGHADFYGDVVPIITFADHLVAGRLDDASSTFSAMKLAELVGVCR